MSMIYITTEPPTQEELEEYKRQKEECRINALADKEKQTYKKAKAIVAVGQIRAGMGMCPSCGHCLIWGDLECDECFQKVKWY